MHIDTQTTPVCVEIEGREYPLAPRTARLMEKLRRAEAAGLREGRPHHRVEMAQLSLLLGRQAFLLLADYVAQKRQGIKNPVYTRDRIPELKDKAECW